MSTANPPSTAGGSAAILRFFDVAMLVVAAPVMILIGVSAAGYLIGAGAWVALRLIGVGVERLAGGGSDAARAVGLRLGFMLARLFALAIVVVLVRRADGQGAGLACLAVIVGGFTAYMAASVLTRPRRNR